MEVVHQASKLKNLVERMTYGEARVYAKENIDFKKPIYEAFKIPSSKTKMSKKEALLYYGNKLFKVQASLLLERVPQDRQKEVIEFLVSIAKAH